MFEGSYARAALCTDIHLVDDYPSHYLTFAARLHRWVRGDWQIARWLFRSVPDANGQTVPNTLPIIARWKIFDNLRRSLMPPAIVALLVAGWTYLPGSAAFWTTMALMVLAFPAYIQVGRSIGSRVAGVPLREHLRAETDNIVMSLRQAAFSIIMLAHQSVVMLDAIGRAIVRLTITHRGLLEWMTAYRAASTDASLGTVFRKMWLAPAAAVGIAVLVMFTEPWSLMLASPILILWFLSPVIAFIAGRPLRHRRAPVTPGERSTLRVLARQTWRFFDELIVADDNWLVPDNYQQNRREPVAHRTSPTNIGLQLLATVSAFDFGYVGEKELLDRLERTFDSLLRMSRYRGHFFNWYDTRTLAPLAPAYISTVDSGNLAGYLLTLRSALTEIIESTPLIGGATLEGIGDALRLFEIELQGSAVARFEADCARSSTPSATSWPADR